MQAAEAYNGIEQQGNLRVSEEQTRELRDAFSRHLPVFYRRAYRHLGNAADAEDAIQDALLSAYKHIDQFRGQAQLSTWLTAIVTNCALMQLRRRPRAIHLSLDEPLGEGQEFALSGLLEAPGPSPEDEYRSTELREQVLEFMDQLSPCLRKAFQLRELDGLTTREAAEMLGVAEGTIKSQVARARAKLKRFMQRALRRRSPGPALASAEVM